MLAANDRLREAKQTAASPNVAPPSASPEYERPVVKLSDIFGSDRSDLAKAIIFREVLGPPVAFRRRVGPPVRN